MVFQALNIDFSAYIIKKLFLLDKADLIYIKQEVKTIARLTYIRLISYNI